MDVKSMLTLARTKVIIISLVMLVVGVLFIAIPEASYKVVTYILAAILIACGLLLIIFYFINFKTTAVGQQLFWGVISLCFGILLMCFTGLLITLFSVGLTLAGIYYTVNGLEYLRAGDKEWWKEFVCGLVEFVLGILFIIFDAFAIDVLWIMLGVFLILDALFIVSTIFWYERAFRFIKKDK